MTTITKITRRRVGALLLWSLLYLLFVFGQAEAVPEKVVSEEPRVEEEVLITSHPVGKRGGRLVTALRAEPRTLNPVIAASHPSRTILRLLMANLIQIDGTSQETEPALAKSWTISEDGRSYTIKLRRGVRFSDGHIFDADDVLFTFQVYLNEAVGSSNRNLLIIGGKPIEVKKLDSHIVELRMAEAYAAGERLFDGLGILPQHLLEESYQQNKLRERWSVAELPDQIVGLGPFRLKKYLPGDRCVLERNPYYWKRDGAGNRLPYLEEITILFVPSDDAQILRFQAGDTDVIDRLSAENFEVLERQAQLRNYQMVDQGPGLTYYFLVFNLNDLSLAEQSSIVAKQQWFGQLAFRRAVSLAIDRLGIVNLVFKKRATALWSHETPGNKRWLNTDLTKHRRSVTEARELLSAARFSWRDHQLIDPEGNKVEFTIITSSSSSERAKMATIIQEDLKALGIDLSIAPLEFRAFVERMTQTYDYEASIMALSGGDADPNAQMPMLLSSGHLHFWRLDQREPTTPWEAEIDRLMKTQITELNYDDRKELYDSVQELMARNLPLIFLVSPHVLVGAKSKLGNFRPTILGHPTLWNAEELYWH